MLKREAQVIVQGVTRNSKTGTLCHAISAHACKVGSKLAQVPGSVCADCYALKGRHVLPHVKDAHTRRLQAMAHPEWVPAMVKLISGQSHFRWFESGDLQGMDNLHAIVEICNRTPGTSHWLPTKEYKLVRRYLKESGDFPGNLTVRVSTPMIDQAPSNAWARYSVTSSSVHQHKAPHGFVCRAPANGGKCGDCRACWDKSVDNVSYKRH
jgi:hypothetical protein